MSKVQVEPFLAKSRRMNRFITFGKQEVSMLNDATFTYLEISQEEETKPLLNFAQLVKESPFTKKLSLQLQQTLDISQRPMAPLIQSAKNSDLKLERQFTFGSLVKKVIEEVPQKELISPLLSTRSSFTEKNPFAKIQESPRSSLKIVSPISSKILQNVKTPEIRKGSVQIPSARKNSKSPIKSNKKTRKSVY